MGQFWRICAVFTTMLAALPTAGCKRKAIENDSHAEAQHLFDSSCAICHGRDGRGGVPAAEGLPPPRNFCDAAFQASRSDDQLKKVIREGKGPMPPFAPLFDDAQLSLLVAYIRGFNPKK
jgi:mono/diheme cytochrome c family protein